jgi:hypothetical protein
MVRAVWRSGTRVIICAIPFMIAKRPAGLIISVFACLLIGLPRAGATDWVEPAHKLASKILAVTGPGATALEISNRSSLAPSEVELARGAVISELKALGVEIVGGQQAATSVHVTFSENEQTFLWVAEIRQGASEPKIAMVAGPGAPTARLYRPSSGFTIRRTLLWAQDSRILDASILSGGSPAHLLVLDPEKVTLLRNEGGHWQQEQAFPIIHSRPWPRDVRGRIVLSKEHLFDVYLPGVVCSALLGATLNMECHEADDPWPLGASLSDLRAFFYWRAGTGHWAAEHARAILFSGAPATPEVRALDTR